MAEPSATERPAIVLRWLWPTERERVAAHLLRLSPEDRYARFATTVTEQHVRDYVANLDPVTYRALGCFIDGELRGVGEFLLLSSQWPRAAELSFSVERPWQGKGIGTELFRRLMLYARNRQVQRIYVVSLVNNRAMRRIAEKFDMALARAEDETEGRLELLWPTPLSLLDELLAEGKGWLGLPLAGDDPGEPPDAGDEGRSHR